MQAAAKGCTRSPAAGATSIDIKISGAMSCRVATARRDSPRSTLDGAFAAASSVALAVEEEGSPSPYPSP